MILPLWRQFGSGGTGLDDGAAPAATTVPIFLDSTQSRWVTPFQTAGPGQLAAGTDIWVKPFTVTTP